MDEAQYSQAKPKTGIKILAIICGLLAVLFAVLTVLTYINLQDTKRELVSSQKQLTAKNNQLAATTLQLGLYRDEVRKADLASFRDVIREYNQKNNTHLTTEGSISRNIYETQLSKLIIDFKDPKTGQIYDYVAVAAVQSPPPLKIGTIQYQWAGKCGAKTLEDTTDHSLSAVATLLENGSMHCIQI